MYPGHNCTNYAAYRLSQNGTSDPGPLGDDAVLSLIAIADQVFTALQDFGENARMLLNKLNERNKKN